MSPSNDKSQCRFCKGSWPSATGRADLIADQRVLVELEALPALGPVHLARTLSYLKAAGLRLGLLVDFGGAPLGREFAEQSSPATTLLAALRSARSETPPALDRSPPGVSARHGRMGDAPEFRRS
jgi:hypothetical protein